MSKAVTWIKCGTDFITPDVLRWTEGSGRSVLSTGVFYQADRILLRAPFPAEEAGYAQQQEAGECKSHGRRFGHRGIVNSYSVRAAIVPSRDIAIDHGEVEIGSAGGNRKGATVPHQKPVRGIRRGVCAPGSGHRAETERERIRGVGRFFALGGPRGIGA